MHKRCPRTSSSVHLKQFSGAQFSLGLSSAPFSLVQMKFISSEHLELVIDWLAYLGVSVNVARNSIARLDSKEGEHLSLYL